MLLVLLGPLILVLLGPLILVPLGPLILVLLTFLHSPRVPITQRSPPNFSSAAIFSSAEILVPVKFSSILVPLTFLHLHLGSPMSEGHPKDFSSTGTFNFSSTGTINFSSTGTINFSSTGTFLHLNAISYAFSSAGTFNFISTGTFNFSSAGTFNLSSAGTFLHLNAISYVFSSAGTFNFSSAGTLNFNSAGTINFSSAKTFLHLNAISYCQTVKVMATWPYYMSHFLPLRHSVHSFSQRHHCIHRLINHVYTKGQSPLLFIAPRHGGSSDKTLRSQEY